MGLGYPSPVLSSSHTPEFPSFNLVCLYSSDSGRGTSETAINREKHYFFLCLVMQSSVGRLFGAAKPGSRFCTLVLTSPGSFGKYRKKGKKTIDRRDAGEGKEGTACGEVWEAIRSSWLLDFPESPPFYQMFGVRIPSGRLILYF